MPDRLSDIPGELAMAIAWLLAWHPLWLLFALAIGPNVLIVFSRHGGAIEVIVVATLIAFVIAAFTDALFLAIAVWAALWPISLLALIVVWVSRSAPQRRLQKPGDNGTFRGAAGKD